MVCRMVLPVIIFNMYHSDPNGICTIRRQHPTNPKNEPRQHPTNPKNEPRQLPTNPKNEPRHSPTNLKNEPRQPSTNPTAQLQNIDGMLGDNYFVPSTTWMVPRQKIKNIPFVFGWYLLNLEFINISHTIRSPAGYCGTVVLNKIVLDFAHRNII